MTLFPKQLQSSHREKQMVQPLQSQPWNKRKIARIEIAA